MGLPMKIYLIIDAGGTYFKSAILNSDAEILKGSTFKTRSYSEGSKEKIIAAYKNTVSNALSFVKKNGMTLGGIGIATPGPFDYIKGVPLMKHKFFNIYGLNLRELIYELSQVSHEVSIRFIHDASASLVGEIWKGNAQGFKNAALVTLGTGLGFSFSQNGVVQYNSQGGPAISIYSLPCKNGIVEDYVSKRGLLNIYQEKCGKTVAQGIEVSDIGNQAKRGDKASIETFGEAGKILAGALHDILDKKGIQCLLFGGQISHSFQYMEETLKTGLKEVKSLQKISVVKNMDTTAFRGVLWSILNEADNSNIKPIKNSSI